MSSRHGALVEDLRETLEQLQSGLVQLDTAQALGLIDRWRPQLMELGEEELGAVVSDLEALRTLITTDGASADAIGRLTAGLGERLLAAIHVFSDDNAARIVERLGNLLFHAGHAMRGPIPSKTSSPS